MVISYYGGYIKHKLISSPSGQPLLVAGLENPVDQLLGLALSEAVIPAPVKLINQVIAMGTHKSEVQHVLSIIAQTRPDWTESFGVNSKELFANFSIAGKPMKIDFVSKGGSVSYGALIETLLDNFRPYGKIMMVEPHPDDIAVHMPRSAALLGQREKLQGYANPYIVTVTNDANGVSDGYALKNFKTLFPDLNSGDYTLDQQKRMIRAQESAHAAAEFGIEGPDYINLDIDIPFSQYHYDDKGIFKPAMSRVAEPAPIDQERIEALIKEKNAIYYFLPLPFSTHPQHRLVSKMFLEAIYKHNPASCVFFYFSDHEANQLRLKGSDFYIARKHQDENVFPEQPLSFDHPVSATFRQIVPFVDLSAAPAVMENAFPSQHERKNGTGYYNMRINNASIAADNTRYPEMFGRHTDDRVERFLATWLADPDYEF